jgi:hypothetical protein
VRTNRNQDGRDRYNFNTNETVADDHNGLPGPVALIAYSGNLKIELAC